MQLYRIAYLVHPSLQFADVLIERRGCEPMIATKPSGSFVNRQRFVTHLNLRCNAGDFLIELVKPRRLVSLNSRFSAVALFKMPRIISTLEPRVRRSSLLLLELTNDPFPSLGIESGLTRVSGTWSGVH